MLGLSRYLSQAPSGPVDKQFLGLVKENYHGRTVTADILGPFLGLL